MRRWTNGGEMRRKNFSATRRFRDVLIEKLFNLIEEYLKKIISNYIPINVNSLHI